MGEPDWFGAMARSLNQLKEVSEYFKIPIFCAGDIFDKWNSPPELINFAIDHLPKMWAIPGQHDLPLHNYSDIKKSAYWTLVETGIITPLEPRQTLDCGDACFQAFPWGFPIQDIGTIPGAINVGIVHQYIWIDDHGYPEAPTERKATKARADFKGFDVLVFGDNHKGFLTKKGDTTIFNCGGFMRRASDEIDYRPQIGLLHASGEVSVVPLDISEDKIEYVAPVKVADGADMDLQEFLDELTGLEETELDFEEAMRRAIRKKKPGQNVRKILLKAMETVK